MRYEYSDIEHAMSCSDSYAMHGQLLAVSKMIGLYNILMIDRWDGNLTMGYYKGGMLQTTKKTYTKMLRHPHPLTSTDATLPGACGTF